MPKRLRIILAAALAVVLVAGVTAGIWWWRDAHRTDLQRAAALAPSDSERLSWTDWAAVRAEVGATLSADSSADDVQAFLDKGYDADLTSTSALVQSAPVLQERFGFSPATADWELFSQSTRGAVVVIHLPDAIDFGDLADRLAGLGYTRPDSKTGVWDGAGDVLSSIGPDLTPELQFFALDAGRHLLFTSDTADYLPAVVSGSGAGLPDSLAQVVDASGAPLSASVYAGDYVCSALAMSHADDTDQAQGDELLAAAGKVNPIEAFAMSAQPDRTVRVLMGFANDDQARTNADSRAALAAGPAPGQGGEFTDRFALGPVTADGPLVRMELRPRKGAYVLSDLSTGPVLFATC